MFKKWPTLRSLRKRMWRQDHNLPFLSSALAMDPALLRSVERSKNRGRKCVLKLLVIENYSQQFIAGDYEKLAGLGPWIVAEIGKLLPGYYREKDILGIFQNRSDEFVLLLTAADSDTFLELEYRINGFREQLEERLMPRAKALTGSPITFGTGIFELENHPASIEAMLAIGYYYTRAMATRQIPPSFNQTRSELLDILDRQRIDVLAQPIMDLGTGDIFGWEILTRGPAGSPYYKPTDLFEMAFSADLLSRLELMVIKRAFREIAERGIREPVFINVTAVSLANRLIYAEVLEYLKLYPGVRPDQIFFEITERHPIKDYRQMSEIIHGYRAHGFRFAIDDAGAGYSSLQTISELVPDIIKIDRSLIQDIDQGIVKKSLLKALIHFARDIECEVIAEGIERQEEADILLQHQVTKAQGYYFAKPAPLQICTDALRDIKEKIQMFAGGTGDPGNQLA